jgi:hypothetical protein
MPAKVESNWLVIPPRLSCQSPDPCTLPSPLPLEPTQLVSLLLHLTYQKMDNVTAVCFVFHIIYMPTIKYCGPSLVIRSESVPVELHIPTNLTLLFPNCSTLSGYHINCCPICAVIFETCIQPKSESSQRHNDPETHQATAIGYNKL